MPAPCFFTEVKGGGVAGRRGGALLIVQFVRYARLCTCINGAMLLALSEADWLRENKTEAGKYIDKSSKPRRGLQAPSPCNAMLPKNNLACTGSTKPRT